MKNQKGEVTIAVMLVMMIVMGSTMYFMRGGHGDHKETTSCNCDKQGHTEAGQQHMHDGDAKDAHQPDKNQMK